MKNGVEDLKIGSLVRFNNKFFEEKFNFIIKSVNYAMLGSYHSRILILNLKDLKIYPIYTYFEELEILK